MSTMPMEAVVPPPNPFYVRQYATNVNGGMAWVSIPAPGNQIAPEDAAYLCDWLQLIIQQLHRIGGVP